MGVGGPEREWGMLEKHRPPPGRAGGAASARPSSARGQEAFPAVTSLPW